MFSHQTRRIKSAAAITLMLFGLTACSSSLLVRNLDWLLERYIDDFFDLSSEQSELLSELVDDSARRSSADSIPALLALLDQTITLNTSNELADALPDLVSSFEQLGERIRADNADNVLRFALTINAEQGDQISEELQHRNRKYHRKYVQPGVEARRKDFEKEVRRDAKRWLGRLSGEQENVLQNFLDEYRLSETEWLASREAWQTAFLDALARPSGDSKERALRELIVQPEMTFSDKQRADSEFNTEHSIHLLQSVVRMSSEKQRKRINKQLLKLRKRVSSFQQALGYLSPDDPGLKQNANR